MKMWPLKISKCIASARENLEDKGEIFQIKLVKEKEEFGKQITSWKTQFDEIKKFNNLDTA